MDAITSAARNGAYPLKGYNPIFYNFSMSSLCSTYCCFWDKKRILYRAVEKSLAIKLHEDSIALDSQGVDSAGKKVVFLHFEGVAPKKIFKFVLLQ